MSMIGICLGLQAYKAPNPAGHFRHFTISDENYPRPGGSARTKAEKIDAIYAAICLGVETVADLAIEVECSHGTVKTAIAFLEGRDKIKCDKQRSGYRYSQTGKP